MSRRTQVNVSLILSGSFLAVSSLPILSTPFGLLGCMVAGFTLGTGLAKIVAGD